MKRVATRPDGIAARGRTRRRILIVGAADLVTQWNAALGEEHHTDYAANVVDAVALLSGAKSFHLCLVDVTLPNLGGFELARRLRALPQFARSPIVFVVGPDASQDLLNGITTSGGHSITRPLQSQQAVGKIIELLDSAE